MRIRLRAHRPQYRIVSRPGAVRVERRGPTGFVAPRVFVSLVLLAFAAMPPAAVYAFSEGSWIAVLAAIPLFTVFPWYPFLALIAWAFGWAVGSYRWIEVDGRAGRVRALRDAYFLWGRRSLAVPEADLRALSVELAESDLPGAVARVTLELVHEDRRWLRSPGRRTTALPFRADPLAERERLFAFAFGLARRLGWEGYAVARSDHLGARIELRRTAEAEGVSVVPSDPGVRAGPGEAVAAAPAGSGPERGERPNEPPGAGALAGIDLPAFEPEALGTDWRVRRWEPGVRVEVRKSGLDRRQLLTAAVVGTLLLNLPTLAAGVAFATGAADEVGLFWKLVVLAVFVSVTLLFNAFLFTEGRTDREAVLDWTEGVARFRADRRSVVTPLEEVERIEVAGVRRPSGRGTEDRTFACEVWAVTAEGRARIAETGASPVEAAPYRTAGAMAEDLAEALGVPWSWEGWEERSLADEARSLWRRLRRRYGP